MFALGLLLGLIAGGFAVFRATPWLIGRLTADERLAFAKKVRAVAQTRRRSNA